MKNNELSGIAKKVFDDLANTYKLDESSLYLAHIIAVSWDHLQQAERILEKEGLILVGRYGQLRSHPANDVAKSNRRLIMQALKQLNAAPVNDEMDSILQDFR